MPNDKGRRRMVVEEVGVPPDVESEETVSSEVVNTEPVEEIKEKVEELQSLTEEIHESVEKSEDLQEDIVKAAEEVLPIPQEVPEQREVDSMPEIKTGGGPNPLAIIIPGIFLLGALLGGIVFYQRGINGGNPEPTSTPPTLADATPVPTASPSAKLDLSKYPINVMNGSGIAGQAGVVKDLLTTAGFTVSKTGNASSYDFTKTVIKAKADVPAEFITQLSGALSKSYTMDANQSLATSSSDTVQVIIGSTKAK